MKALAQLSGSTLAFAAAAWMTLVFVAWLFTPGGQAVIFVVQLAIQEGGAFVAELPLATMRTWAIIAGVVAIGPPLIVAALWSLARHRVGQAAA